MGAPLGMAVGIYLSEVGRSGPFASTVRFVNDILLSAPSVLVGLFVYQIIVIPMHGFSGFAGSVALALLGHAGRGAHDRRHHETGARQLPRRLHALGARDSTTIMRVVVPAAFSGVLTGILLAVARISGETAPLIFTSLGNDTAVGSLTDGPMASLPLAIYSYAKWPSADLNNLAWTGALIITVGVLTLNIAAASRTTSSRAGGAASRRRRVCAALPCRRA